MRILPQQILGFESFADVFAGAGRTVDGADDGNVVARAVAPVAAVIALPVTRFGRRGRWRAILAIPVIAIERMGDQIVDVNMIAGLRSGWLAKPMIWPYL